MIKYAQYYIVNGIRTTSMLARPKLRTLDHYFLPLLSVYHNYHDTTPTDYGLKTDNDVLHRFKGTVLLNFVTGYSLPNDQTPLGITGRGATVITPTIIAYFAENKQFRNLERALSMAKDPRNLVVYDYGMTDLNYRYRNTYAHDYQQWYNRYSTIIGNVGKVAATSNRQNFIEFYIPELIPPLSIWNLVDNDYAATAPNPEGIYIRRALMNLFDTPEKRMLLDLWVWLGENSQKSVLGSLNADQLDKTNIVFRAGTKFIVLNLGLLDSWIQRENRKNTRDSVLPVKVAKIRLLSMMMTINSARSVVAVEDEIEVDENADDIPPALMQDTDQAGMRAITDSPDARKELDIDVNKMAPGVNKLSIVTQPTKDMDKLMAMAGIIPGSERVKAVRDDGVALANPNDVSLQQELTDTLDDDILKDIEQLEFIYKQKEIEENLYSDDSVVGYEPPSDDLVQSVVEVASYYAGKGSLSSAEYRRLVDKATNYQTMPNPFGPDGTLESAITIDPEKTKIEKHTPLAEKIPGVIDKSMLSSSLEVMDRKYITEFMHKDIGNMVMSIQKMGIIVDNYEVTKYSDINDSYEMHNVRIIPISGKPSVLKFRLPIVSEDGTFRAGGVKYRMRKQKGDYPIVKVKPTEVAMTSYYSKMFVRRSERAVFNYDDWLTNRIIAMGIDQMNASVGEIVISDVFKPTKSRVYSAISKRIASFTANGYRYSFDANKIDEFFQGINTTGTLPIARSDDGSFLHIDVGGTVHKRFGNTDTKLGSIESILGLDPNKAPLDMAEIGLFGKTIPLGILLAYTTGLSSLLKTVNAKYRKAKRGTNYNLLPSEYAIKFEDQVLIFDRSDRVTMLLMAGFNRYHRDIKNLPLHTFDKRDVYGLILDNNDISSRRLKEVDFMFKMWVDHITKEILVEMGMPTDLFSLFLKATEMLINDEYPETPIRRIKGYERFSGILYTELINTLRAYNARPSTTNATISINPFSVWMNIQNDQTVIGIDESNPIQSLKDMEIVVYRGAGGRSNISMTADARKFHRTDMGVISEATVDSGDVGTIEFLTADPNFTSIRGLTRQLDGLDGNAAKLVSTSMLLATGSDMDD